LDSARVKGYFTAFFSSFLELTCDSVCYVADMTVDYFRLRLARAKTMKPILLVLLAVLLAPPARADTITITGTVSVQVGCWNPAVCGNPAAFWNALDLPSRRST